MERLWSQQTAILMADCIRRFTVDIWGQSEGIENTILPSVGIFDSNLNIQIDIKKNPKVGIQVQSCSQRANTLHTIYVLPFDLGMPISSK